MSRIGKLPIALPKGVKALVREGVVVVSGPKGELRQGLVPNLDVKIEESRILVERKNDLRPTRAAHGMLRALINNMVHGVSSGFSKNLEVIGVGYRADVKGKNLVLHLGYSHPIEFPIDQGIEIAVSKDNVISINGIDKQQVGQVAARIRELRAPDHYKGKGVRYQGERVRIKAGKAT